jgi:hypothetical protein
MIFRAFIAMVTADAIDRHMREQQYRARIAAEQARAAAARAAHSRPLEAPGFDPRRPERPLPDPDEQRTR